MTLSAFLHGLLYLLLVVALLVILKRYVYGFSERTLKDALPFLRRIILEDLENLLHPEVEQYIRENYSYAEFKKTQWKRIRLALQYLADLGGNAKVFQSWGRYERRLSRRYPDLERKRASLELITACVQVRICVLSLSLRLHCWMLRMAFVPFLPPPSFASVQRSGGIDIFVFYARVKAAAGRLGQPYGENMLNQLLKGL